MVTFTLPVSLHTVLGSAFLVSVSQPPLLLTAMLNNYNAFPHTFKEYLNVGYRLHILFRFCLEKKNLFNKPMHPLCCMPNHFGYAWLFCPLTFEEFCSFVLK